MFTFIWDKKPDKIKRKVLYQDYSKGGLKMLDLQQFILSLKSSWITRILDKNNHGQWKKIYLRRLKQYGSELIFECELRKSDIDVMFKKGSFLSDILSFWNKIKNIKLKDDEEVYSKVIWNNSNLRIANKPYFYQSWFDRGIKFIKHIHNNTSKRFYSFIDLVDKYNLPASDFLKYMTLIASITMSFKNALNNEYNNNRNRTGSFNILTKEANKFFIKISKY